MPTNGVLAKLISITDRFEIRDGLKDLRWSQAELGRRLGRNPSTVSLWLTGVLDPPQYALSYVELALEMQGFREAATDILAKRLPPLRW